MSWVAVGSMTAIGAVQGAQQRKAQQEANQQNANLNAAQMEYSPWTGVKPGVATAAPVTASAFGGAEKGALSGAMFAHKGGAPGNDEASQLASAKGGAAMPATTMSADEIQAEKMKRMLGQTSGFGQS